MRVVPLLGRVISPIAILGLKLHTRITGTERARVIIYNERREILLVRGLIGEKWTFPGGGLHRNEAPEVGALRELYEETGVALRSAQHVITFERATSPVGYTAHVFVATISTDMVPDKSHNPVEIIDMAWFSTDQLPSGISSIVPLSLAAIKS